VTYVLRLNDDLRLAVRIAIGNCDESELFSLVVELDIVEQQERVVDERVGSLTTEAPETLPERL
jgi:hypothetical protein